MPIFKSLETLVNTFTNAVLKGLEESVSTAPSREKPKSIIEQLYEETARPLPYSQQQQWRSREQHNAARAHAQHGHKSVHHGRAQSPSRRG